MSKVSDAQPTASSATEVVAEETGWRPLQERPQLGVATPAVLFLSAAAMAGCFFWFQKHCASKIYPRLVRPRWGAEDWRKYNDFLRTAFNDLFTHRSKGYSGEEEFRKNNDKLFGEGASEE